MSVTGSRLRELREETGKSQGEVAKLIGISILSPCKVFDNWICYNTRKQWASRQEFWNH